MAAVNQTIIMAILIALGLLCGKLGIITTEGNKSLSSLVLMVVCPAVVFVSYQKPFDLALLTGLLWSFGLAALCFGAAILLSYLLVRGRERDKLAIERFSCIYSNCAFMGIPLAQALYGADGVFYLTAFITMFNLFVWTHGVLLMKGNAKGGARSLLKALASPAILATVVGFVFFLIGFRLPSPLSDALNFVAALNTPLAMFVAGASIARVNLLGALKKLRLYYLSLLKLLVIPGVCLLLLFKLPLDPVVIGVSLLAIASPTATIGSLMAIRFGKDAGYASEIFGITTLFSVLTLPAIMSLYAMLR